MCDVCAQCSHARAHQRLLEENEVGEAVGGRCNEGRMQDQADKRGKALCVGVALVGSDV